MDTGSYLSITVGHAAEAADLIEGRDVGSRSCTRGRPRSRRRAEFRDARRTHPHRHGGVVEGSTRLTAEQLKTALMGGHVRCSSALTEPVPAPTLSASDAAPSRSPTPPPCGSNQQLVERSSTSWSRPPRAP
ncbi:hypothetical protein QJS66_00830 [Kocuria rhizophila]|nr:hypothetical protein QJS66_00830 [Kocuria rhizophila]